MDVDASTTLHYVPRRTTATARQIACWAGKQERYLVNKVLPKYPEVIDVLVTKKGSSNFFLQPKHAIEALLICLKMGGKRDPLDQSRPHPKAQQYWLRIPSLLKAFPHVAEGASTFNEVTLKKFHMYLPLSYCRTQEYAKESFALMLEAYYKEQEYVEKNFGGRHDDKKHEVLGPLPDIERWMTSKSARRNGGNYARCEALNKGVAIAQQVKKDVLEQRRWAAQADDTHYVVVPDAADFDEDATENDITAPLTSLCSLATGGTGAIGNGDEDNGINVRTAMEDGPTGDAVNDENVRVSDVADAESPAECSDRESASEGNANDDDVEGHDPLLSLDNSTFESHYTRDLSRQVPDVPAELVRQALRAPPSTEGILDRNAYTLTPPTTTIKLDFESDVNKSIGADPTKIAHDDLFVYSDSEDSNSEDNGMDNDSEDDDDGDDYDTGHSFDIYANGQTDHDKYYTDAEVSAEELQKCESTCFKWVEDGLNIVRDFIPDVEQAEYTCVRIREEVLLAVKNFLGENTLAYHSITLENILLYFLNNVHRWTFGVEGNATISETEMLTMEALLICLLHQCAEVVAAWRDERVKAIRTSLADCQAALETKDRRERRKDEKMMDALNREMHVLTTGEKGDVSQVSPKFASLLEMAANDFQFCKLASEVVTIAQRVIQGIRVGNESRMRLLQAVGRVFEKRFKLPNALSFAMVGRMKAGKSTLVLTQILSNLAPSRRAPMTAVATMYVHRAGINAPILTIPFYEGLNETVELCAQRIEAFERSSGKSFEVFYSYNDAVDVLAKVRDRSLTFDRTYKGTENVYIALLLMNDFVRLCHHPSLNDTSSERSGRRSNETSALPNPVAHLSSIDDLPRVEIAFAAFRGQSTCQKLGGGMDRPFAFIDCPGTSEAHMKWFLRHNKNIIEAVEGKIIALHDPQHIEDEAEDELISLIVQTIGDKNPDDDTCRQWLSNIRIAVNKIDLLQNSKRDITDATMSLANAYENTCGKKLTNRSQGIRWANWSSQTSSISGLWALNAHRVSLLYLEGDPAQLPCRWREAPECLRQVLTKRYGEDGPAQLAKLAARGEEGLNDLRTLVAKQNEQSNIHSCLALSTDYSATREHLQRRTVICNGLKSAREHLIQLGGCFTSLISRTQRITSARVANIEKLESERVQFVKCVKILQDLKSAVQKAKNIGPESSQRLLESGIDFIEEEDMVNVDNACRKIEDNMARTAAVEAVTFVLNENERTFKEVEGLTLREARTESMRQVCLFEPLVREKMWSFLDDAVVDSQALRLVGQLLASLRAKCRSLMPEDDDIGQSGGEAATVFAAVNTQSTSGDIAESSTVDFLRNGRQDNIFAFQRSRAQQSLSAEVDAPMYQNVRAFAGDPTSRMDGGRYADARTQMLAAAMLQLSRNSRYRVSLKSNHGFLERSVRRKFEGLGKMYISALRHQLLSEIQTIAENFVSFARDKIQTVGMSIDEAGVGGEDEREEHLGALQAFADDIAELANKVLYTFNEISHGSL